MILLSVYCILDRRTLKFIGHMSYRFYTYPLLYIDVNVIHNSSLEITKLSWYQNEFTKPFDLTPKLLPSLLLLTNRCYFDRYPMIGLRKKNILVKVVQLECQNILYGEKP